MYTFGSASFTALVTKPDGADAVDVTELHIPGGNLNYIDIGGKLSNRIDLALYFDTASGYTAMRNAVGSASTLTIMSGSYTDTVLISLQRTWLSSNLKASFADATFIVP